MYDIVTPTLSSLQMQKLLSNQETCLLKTLSNTVEEAEELSLSNEYKRASRSC
jgi:hypothetical protein